MAEQFSNAPAPSREEFEDLAEQIGTVDSKITAVKIYYVQCSYENTNQNTNYYFNLPQGISYSEYDAIACFGQPINSSQYVARVFAYIQDNNTLRINICSNDAQNYRVNVLFVKKGTALTPIT